MTLTRPHRAVATAFFVAGWVPAAWGTRIPSIQAHLGLSAGALGLAVLGLESGAVLGLPAGGALVAHAGSRRALRLGFALFLPALVTVGLAGSLPALAAALGLMAMGNSIVDVAMNSQGAELERRSGRSLLSGLHAGHPAGLVAGGLAGTAATAAGLPVGAHFALVAVVGLLLLLVTSGRLLDDRTGPRPPAFVRPTRRLAGLGLLAFCAFGLDGAAANWSAVDLRAEHGAGAGLAAAAFTGFALAMAGGRLLGDRLVARHGRVRVLQASGLLAACGGAVVVLAPAALVGLAGWVLFGLGLAAVAPTLLGAAARDGDMPPAAAIAGLSTVGYLGSFTGPPVIGGLAQSSSLSTALILLVAGGLVLAGLAPVALGQRASRTTSRAALSSRSPR